MPQSFSFAAREAEGIVRSFVRHRIAGGKRSRTLDGFLRRRYVEHDKDPECMSHRRFRFSIFFYILSLAAVSAAPRYGDLVDVRAVDPSIQVELRYATPDNITGHALYPPDTPALVRPTTAARLERAQRYLQARHYGLKIWDAYRPVAAQLALWRHTHNGSFVADPVAGHGSLHTWGVAVDATLVDAKGNEVTMPTKFDEFTPAAKLHYRGIDPSVKFHLKLLQRAMREGGFYGMRTEWWHFIAYDWKRYGPIREADRTKQ
jgi:D-alanyl-D-alanine dipeptidase